MNPESLKPCKLCSSVPALDYRSGDSDGSYSLSCKCIVTIRVYRSVFDEERYYREKFAGTLPPGQGLSKYFPVDWEAKLLKIWDHWTRDEETHDQERAVLG